MEQNIIPSAEEIARVKGLGFLRDKTTPDAFNARVITKNGKESGTLEIAFYDKDDLARIASILSALE